MKLEYKKQRTYERDSQILQQFNYYYNKKRIRIDDVYSKIGKEFCLSPEYVKRLINRLRKGV